MTDYEDLEYSAHDGRPQEAYLFSGSGEEWKFTSFDRIVTVNGADYTPVPISRSEPEVTEDSMKSDLTISLAVNNALVSYLLQSLVEGPVSVTIFRKHWDIDAWLTFWKGRVVNFTPGLETELQCESVFTSVRRPGLRAKYQLQCRHALYTTGEHLTSLCEAVKENFVVTAHVVSAENTDDIETDLSYYAENYFLGGFVKYGDYTFRFIVGESGGGRFLTLDRPLDLDPGTEISVYPGCDHTYGTCGSKFNNAINFGGFPWVPEKNPFSTLTGGF